MNMPGGESSVAGFVFLFMTIFLDGGSATSFIIETPNEIVTREVALPYYLTAGTW
jgi:hypothetical protein